MRDTDETIQKVGSYLDRQDAKKPRPLAPEFLRIVRELAIMRAKMDDAAEAGLFPSEAEIAKRLSQDPKDWPARAVVLEREGLPKIDPLMGGRFWPAVEEFFRARYGLSPRSPAETDGEENLDALR